MPVALKLAPVTQTRRRWVILGMLVCLHLALLQGLFTDVGRMLLLGHLGLFMLWQPFVRAEYRLSAAQFSGVVTLVAAIIAWLNWWVLVVWVMVLTGIVGGKVFFFGARWTKAYYLLVLAYLLAVLLVFVVPQLIPHSAALPEAFSLLARFGLPVLFLLMALVPAEPEAEGEPEVIDFVYSIFVFLLVAVLVLGSLALMVLAEKSYVAALLTTIVVVSAVLLFLGWVWNPRAGFSGLGILFSRYLMSIGLPLERWLHDLADHAEREEDPLRFLEAAVSGMARLPWVSGGEWEAAGSKASFGVREGSCSEFSHHALRIALYSQQPPSPALAWHFNLLAQLVSEFYLAKVRGEQLQHLSYLKAVHETGARLTHDVKNLLQSLNTLCFAAAETAPENQHEFQALLRRQLPAITQRLQHTVEKLRRPGEETMAFVPFGQWWRTLVSRYREQGIDFGACGESDESVPLGLFNSVAENLIQNALDKRIAHAPLSISVTPRGEGGIGLRVCDDGQPVPSRIAATLFAAPVSSSSGLGIGLYQAARHARHYGYALRLADNRSGCVCFELARDEDAERGGHPST